MIQRFSSRSSAPILVALSVVVASFGIAACFSQRAPTDATVTTATCATPSKTAGSTVVFIRDFTFQTQTVHVTTGGSIAWVNCEPTNIPHSSNSDASGWGSGLIAPAAAFVRTFPTAGTFTYHCAVHPTMKATVIVD